jgi:hypothetical protein
MKPKVVIKDLRYSCGEKISFMNETKWYEIGPRLKFEFKISPKLYCQSLLRF